MNELGSRDMDGIGMNRHASITELNARDMGVIGINIDTCLGMNLAQETCH